MKKIISLLLVFTMLVSTFAVAGITGAFATEIDSVNEISELAEKKDGEYLPVVFIPGIGQSETYLYNDDGTTASHWNLIGVNTDFDAKAIITLVKAAGPLILTLLVGKNLVSVDALEELMQLLFKNCMLDKDGNSPENVETPLFETSLANYETKYPENDKGKTGKEIFLKRIPCQDLIDEIGEENVYCYNYSAFSYTFREADGLNDFIKNVVFKEHEGVDKVILVPMSMGATVVSAYLSKYAAEEDIDKVVSIVGAWNGSDVFADLMELKYADNSKELLYNGVIADLVGDPWGNLINVALRLFPQPVLREFIDDALGAVISELICTTTSFFSLIPYDRYDAIATKLLSGPEYVALKRETDKYHEVQGNLKKTLYTCRDEYDMEFYFICGYNMGFGEETSDFQFFQFFETASKTNSDEIIQISSTGVGVTYATAGTQLSADYVAKNPVCTDKTHNHISPDKSIDVSTSYFPETTWCFNEQTHELTYNDTALELAYAIVLDEVKSVNDTEMYPQFNDSRDVKKLTKDYIPHAKALLNDEYEKITLTAEQKAKLQTLVDDAEAMVARTINNREEDDKIIKALYDYMVEIGRYSAPTEPTTGDKILEFLLEGLNTIIYKVVGTRGFSDFFGEVVDKIA